MLGSAFAPRCADALRAAAVAERSARSARARRPRASSEGVARRPRVARRVRSREGAAEGAARDRGGARGGGRAPARRARGARRGRRLRQLLPRPRRAFVARCSPDARRPRRRPRPARSSSSTRTSTRTRPRTSATCATPSSATCSSARCGTSGDAVEVQNYLDDTGVQVADVVAGAARTSDGVRTLEARRGRRSRSAALPGRRRATRRASRTSAGTSTRRSGGRTRRGPRRRRGATRSLHAIEAGDNETARIAAAVAEARLLGAPRDDGPHRHRLRPAARARATSSTKHFWGARLRDAEGAGRRRTSRPRASTRAAGSCGSPDSEEFAGLEEPDKILVRSNGTVTYTGKDIAYQLWKFGLLGDRLRLRARSRPTGTSGAVRRRRFRTPSGAHPLWRTAARRRRRRRARASAAAARVVNVIDVRQSYPQKVVKEGLRVARLRRRRRTARSTSPTRSSRSRRGRARARGALRRGVPALAPRTRRSPTSRCRAARGSASRRTTSSSSLLERSRAEVASAPRRGRTPRPATRPSATRARSPSARCATSCSSSGATRSSPSTSTRRSNFEGDTGPYLQYSLVRAGNIFRKLEEKGIPARRRRGRARRRRLGGRPLVHPPRRGVDPGGRRARRRVARALDPGAARVRPRPGVQPVLPPPPDPPGGRTPRSGTGGSPSRVSSGGRWRGLLGLLGIPEPGRM